MALPMHILQSLEIPSVTQVSIYCPTHANPMKGDGSFNYMADIYCRFSYKNNNQILSKVA